MGIRPTKRTPTRIAAEPAQPAPGALRSPTPGPRGLRGPGRGRVSYVEAPPEWRGTTVQIYGLFPFAVGGGSPTIGVPLGRNLLTGATVCCDPLAWFQRAKLILNPSMFLLGLPALGKSTLVRRMVIGLAGSGTVPLILGDLKPDYSTPSARWAGRSSGSAAAWARSTSWTSGRWTTPPTSSPRPAWSPAPRRCARRPTAGAPRWSRRC